MRTGAADGGKGKRRSRYSSPAMPSTTFSPSIASASAASPAGDARSGSAKKRSTPTAAGPAARIARQAGARGRDAQRLLAARQLLKALCVAQRRLDGGIAIRRLVVKEHEVLHPRELAQLDAHHVARMAPVLLDRDRLGERIHGVEDDEIGGAEKAHDRFGLRTVLGLVLRVGAV